MRIEIVSKMYNNMPSHSLSQQDELLYCTSELRHFVISVTQNFILCPASLSVVFARERLCSCRFSWINLPWRNQSRSQSPRYPCPASERETCNKDLWGPFWGEAIRHVQDSWTSGSTAHVYVPLNYT